MKKMHVDDVTVSSRELNLKFVVDKSIRKDKWLVGVKKRNICIKK